MNSHVSYEIAKTLNWRYPVSFGWRKTERKEDSILELIGLSVEHYPAPSVTDIFNELPTGTNLQKYDRLYAADYSDRHMGKSVTGLTIFTSENPADALAILFVWLKRRNGENISYAKDFVIPAPIDLPPLSEFRDNLVKTRKGNS